MIKVCCSNGKPYDSLIEAERIGGCNHDTCVGPVEVEEFDLLLIGLGTFDPEECVSAEELGKLIFKKGE